MEVADMSYDYPKYDIIVKVSRLIRRGNQQEIYKKFKKVCKSYGIQLTRGIVLALQLFIDKFGDNDNSNKINNS
jgi:hypothetical protein